MQREDLLLHQLGEISKSLRSIAVSLEKLANPPVPVTKSSNPVGQKPPPRGWGSQGD